MSSCKPRDLPKVKRDFPKLPGYKTPDEVAEELKISSALVRRYLAQGRMKAYRMSRDLVVPVEEVERFKKIERRVGWPKGRAK